MMASIVLVGLGTACKDKMCPASPLPDPWKPYAAVIPGETVICGSNRGAIDNNPPTQLFVYYKGRDPKEAFYETGDKLKSEGFQLSDFSTLGEGDYQVWTGKFAKAGVSIALDVNKNDNGVQGMFVMEPAAP